MIEIGAAVVMSAVVALSIFLLERWAKLLAKVLRWAAEKVDSE